MLIGDLSARTGVSPRSLRYYEQQGLLGSTRRSNGYRVYDSEAVEVVGRIRSLLAAGLSTDVIATVLPCARGDRPELELCPDLLRTLRAEVARADDRISALEHSRDALRGYLAEG